MTSSDGVGSGSIPEEFKQKYGLDDEWEVRFTADELRAREMAKQYRETGYEVRAVPLQPGAEVLDIDELAAFGEGLDLEHDPLQYVENEACAPCLEDTYVVFTKGEPEQADDTSEEELVYELDE